MIKNCVLLVVFLYALNLGSQNFTGTYSLASVTPSSGAIDPSPVPVAKGLVFKPLEAIGVSPNSSASGRFSFSGWPLGAIDGSDTYSVFAGALSGSAYYECKILVAAGFTLTVQSFEFSMRRSTTGIRNFSVRCSRDNFSSDLAASTGTNNKVSVLPVNLFFWNYDSVSTSSDQKGMLISLGNTGKNITDSITVRIYGWNAEQSGGSFSIDNLSFSGLVVDSALLAGTNKLHADQPVSWFPNPCTGGQIYFSEPVSLMLFDFAGVMVLAEKEPTKQFDISSLQEGIYFLQIGSTRQKLVVHRVN